MANSREYYFKEGCYIEEWHNSSQDTECSVARVRVEPFQTTRLHSLIKTAERYIILSGVGEVTVGEKSWLVSETDVVTIDADTPQKIVNTGPNDLIFLAVCTPRFQEHNYVDLE